MGHYIQQPESKTICTAERRRFVKITASRESDSTIKILEGGERETKKIKLTGKNYATQSIYPMMVNITTPH